MKKVNFGILGCGKMAELMTQEIKASKNAEVVAVASRNKENAKQFATSNEIESYHDDYLDLIKNPSVEVVYVTLPHTFHAQWSIEALKSKKAVLCEKPCTINTTELKEVLQTATQNNTFYAEALWTQYLPQFRKAKQWVLEGKIGKVVSVESEFNIEKEYEYNHRLYNPNIGGGALLDLGIYPAMAILEFLDSPDSMEVEMDFTKDGVDFETRVHAQHGDAKSILSCCINKNMDSTCTVIGTEGHIHFDGRFQENCHGYLYQNNKLVSKTDSYIGTYRFMIYEVSKCYLNGEIESKIHNHSKSKRLMLFLENIRKKKNFKYPSEQG